MIKEADKEKKEHKGNPRGWEALKIMLQEEGLTGAEIEEARSCFYKGIEILSKLFLSYYLLEENRNNGNFLKK